MSAPVSPLRPEWRDPHGLAAAIEATVADAVRSCLSDHVAPEQPAARGRRMVTRTQAAEYLSVSKAQIDVWARRGVLTRRRHGRLVRYDLAELDRFADGWEQS